MKRKATIAACVLIIAMTNGCAWYSRQAWTPDGFNYTVQRDRASGEQSDYFGLSWNLKPEKK